MSDTVLAIVEDGSRGFVGCKEPILDFGKKARVEIGLLR